MTLGRCSGRANTGLERSWSALPEHLPSDRFQRASPFGEGLGREADQGGAELPWRVSGQSPDASDPRAIAPRAGPPSLRALAATEDRVEPGHGAPCMNQDFQPWI